MKMLRDERGQAAVFIALVMGFVLVGCLALAVDVSMLFREKRVAQAASDSAAIAAAEEQSYGNATAAAKAMASLHGFAASTVTVNNPPAYGGYAGNSAYTEVIINNPTPTYLMRFFKTNTVNVTARSVSGGGLVSPTCICLAGTSGEVLNLSNDAKLNATGCGVMDNSSSNNALGVVGSARINALSLGTVSTTWNNASNYSSNVNGGGSITASTHIVTGVAANCAPTLPAAPTWGACLADPYPNWVSGTVHVGPSAGGTQCYNALTVGANGNSIFMDPGIYVIKGGELHFESGSGGYSNLGGNGVFFYLTGGATLVVDSGANMNVTAPSSGTYSGILVVQDPADTNTISIQGGSNTTFNGAIYAPNAGVNLGNGSTSGYSAEVYANSLTMEGGAILNATAISNLGTLNLSSAKVAE
jgi:Flp pilus assembly protein TadG